MASKDIGKPRIERNVHAADIEDELNHALSIDDIMRDRTGVGGEDLPPMQGVVQMGPTTARVMKPDEVLTKPMRAGIESTFGPTDYTNLPGIGRYIPPTLDGPVVGPGHHAPDPNDHWSLSPEQQTKVKAEVRGAAKRAEKYGEWSPDGLVLGEPEKDG